MLDLDMLLNINKIIILVFFYSNLINFNKYIINSSIINIIL